jgi:2,4-dienoyl-CoA reductase-like NADH-dependent reductase (Old Yellow Enzyme family)
MVPDAVIPNTPGYQVPFAARVKSGANIPTGAVGLITEAAQAEAILQAGQADIVLLARAFLRDAYWPVAAAQALQTQVTPPVQYGRAFKK